ncbi:methyltransferase domain-containing protein [Candidatus Woesearchaeota archaeon]|nr:methyltransferase domain-containing protein [Candidatus Woesearchaeota archaeon]
MAASSRQPSVLESLTTLSEDGVMALSLAIKEEILSAANNFSNSAYYTDTAQKPHSERLARMEAYVDHFDRPDWNGVTARMLSWLLSMGHYPKTVVDAGCGPGLSSEVILRKLEPERLILVDMIPEALDMAKMRLEPVAGSRTKLDYMPGNFQSLDTLIQEPVDLIVMRAASRYLPEHLHTGTYRKMREMLSESGAVLLDVPIEKGFLTLELMKAFAQALTKVFQIRDQRLVEAAKFPFSLEPSEGEEAEQKYLADAGFSNLSQRQFCNLLQKGKKKELIDHFVKRAAYVVRQSLTDYPLVIGKQDELHRELAQNILSRTLPFGSIVAFLAEK